MDREFAIAVASDLRMLANRSHQTRVMVTIVIAFTLFQSIFIAYLLTKL